MTPDQLFPCAAACVIIAIAICITICNCASIRKEIAVKSNYDELRKTAFQNGFGEVPIKTVTTKTTTEVTESINFSWQKGAITPEA